MPSKFDKDVLIVTLSAFRAGVSILNANHAYAKNGKSTPEIRSFMLLSLQ
jgi:hypothetical protein